MSVVNLKTNIMLSYSRERCLGVSGSVCPASCLEADSSIKALHPSLKVSLNSCLRDEWDYFGEYYLSSDGSVCVGLLL